MATQIESEAARWLARKDGQSWSAADQEAFEHWLALSPAHRIAALRLGTVWDKADRLRAIADTGRALARRTPRKAWQWRSVAPLALAASLAAIAAPNILQSTRATDYRTTIGGFQRVPLEDGSKVELNTSTELSIAFSKDNREVSLERGEAFFTVAKDPDRPFIVSAADYRIVAVGTAFSVRREGAQVTVKVTEGKVRVERDEFLRSPQAIGLVGAGHAVKARSGAAVVTPETVSRLEDDSSWREGLLVFKAQRLDEVAAEFNRYNQRRLIVDPSASNVRIDGTFKPQNLEGFLRLLAQGFRVQSRMSEDAVVLSRPSSEPTGE